MEVSSSGSSSGAPIAAQVKLQKGASRQLAAVVSTIMSGVQQSAAAIASGKGQNLNITA